MSDAIMRLAAGQARERELEGRYVCTKDAPWNEAIGGHVVHPDAKSDGGCAEGCCDDYVCPNCGTKWRTESPA